MSASYGQGPTFDLCDQPWIPVVRDGSEALASLRTCITQAHLIDSLSTNDGPTFAGSLRLLMALMMDAYGQPADDDAWAARRAIEHFDAEALDAYIAAVGRSRFDLFDAEFPFMQSVNVPAEGKSVAELLPHVATGNRTPLWTPDTDATPRPLTYAEAAQALVAAQAVIVPNPGRAAGDDPPESWAGSSFAGRVGIIGFSCPVGDTLFETLMLNLPNGAHQVMDATDLPAWRRDTTTASRRKRFADGTVDLLTWTPRRVRLIPDNGVVTRVGFRGGDALPALDFDHEPHTALRRSEGKPNTPPAGQWYPRKHLRHTLDWRGIPRLLALGERRSDSQPPQVLKALGDRVELLPTDYRVTVFSLLVEYGSMSAVIDDMHADIYPLPVRAFGEAELDVRDALVDLVATADRVRYLVLGYARDVYAVTSRDLDRERKASNAFAAAAEAQLVAQIDSITRRFLFALATEPDALVELKAAWAQQLGQRVDAAVAAIQAECGPNVFTVLSKDGKVSTYPAAVRESQLRHKLVPYLGDTRAEAQHQ